jgi:hypothetical protein
MPIADFWTCNLHIYLQNTLNKCLVPERISRTISGLTGKFEKYFLISVARKSSLLSRHVESAGTASRRG